MTKIATLKNRWMKEEGFKKAYEESQAEFELARKLIQARIQSGLSQEDVAELMETSQSTVARLESGKTLPSMRTLKKFAEATNSAIEIQFRPLKPSKLRATA
jgi:transcriptional regulator with XRE-family HTH domain